MLEEITNRDAALTNIQKTTVALKALELGGLDYTKAKVLLESKYFKMLKITFGHKVALKVFETKLNESKEKIRKSEKDYDKFKIRSLKEQIKLGQVSLIDSENLSKLTKDEQGQVAKLNDLKESYLDIQKSEVNEFDRFTELGQTDAYIGASPDEQLRMEAKLQNQLDKEQIKRQEDLDFISSEIEDTRRSLRAQGIGVSVRKNGAFAADADAEAEDKISISDDEAKERTPWMKWWRKQQKRQANWNKKFFTYENGVKRRMEWKEHFAKMIGWKMISSIGWKKLGGKALQFMAKAGIIFLQIILFITLAVIGFFALKRLGIFQWLQWVFEGVIIAVGSIIEWIGKIFTAFGDFWTSVEVLFSGEGDFLKNLWTALGKLGMLLWTLTGAIWTDVIWPILDEVIFNPIHKFFKKYFNFGDSWGDKLKAVLLGIAGIVLLCYLGILMIPIVVAALPYLIGIAIVAAIISALTGGAKAAGGIASGRTLVGERGPEIVDLPAGSRVYSNEESKRMSSGRVTNNITVNVQGRIGASDTEVRDMATKVSKIITREINRSTSSATRG